MRKRILILMAALSFTLGAATVYAEENASQEAELQEKIEANRALPEHQEGYVEEAEGCYYVVNWCKNQEADRNIYGEFCFPEDFDETKTYPVVIMSHQNMGSHRSFKNPGWMQYLAQEGDYISYTFDFCGGTKAPNCLSDMDYSESTDETQVSDLNAVIDFAKGQSFCDTDHVFLLGGSRGGRDTALAGAQHDGDIAGLILLYPALDSVMDQISGYTGDVLLIHGINDQSVPYQLSVEAATTVYGEANSELLLLTGEKAVHSFDGVHENLREIAEAAVLKFLDVHTEGEVEDK